MIIWSAWCTAVTAALVVIVVRQMGFVMMGRLAHEMIPRAMGKTTAHYTAQKILPDLAWLKTGCTDSKLRPGDFWRINVCGLDLRIGKTSAGKLFCIGDKVPPTGTSLRLGGEVNGDLVPNPRCGSKSNIVRRKSTTRPCARACVPVESCSSPIGSLRRSFKGCAEQLAVIDVRSSFFGGNVEVLVDVSSRKAFESDYWHGVLDAQGKIDGTFY